VTQRALRAEAAGNAERAGVSIDPAMFALLTEDRETNEAWCVLGPLETVDPHDPLGPLGDRHRPFRSAKEVQQSQGAQEDQQFGDENSIRSRGPSARKKLEGACPLDEFLSYAEWRTRH
jgi:hypothetical protein